MSGNIPIWVTDPAGNNNPYLIIRSNKYVVVGKAGNNQIWTVQLFDDVGDIFWTVTLNPDTTGGSGAGAVFGAVVDHSGNAWVLWEATNPPRNVLWKFAAVNGASSSFVLSSLTSLNISGNAGATLFAQMAIDTSDNMSIAGTVPHTFPMPGGATTVGKGITINNGLLASTTGVLPNLSPQSPQFASANVVGVAVTPNGGVVVGLQSAGFFDSNFFGDTNSSDIQAVSGGGLNQIWAATVEFVQQNLQCLSSDGLERIVGQFQSKQSGHTQTASFVFAYKLDGALAWQTSIADGSASSTATCIDGDKSGNVYIAFSGSTTSIKKFNSSGSLILTTTQGDAANDAIYLVAALTGVIGSSGGATYSFWDGTTGNVTWTKTLPGGASVLGIGRQSWPAS